MEAALKDPFNFPLDRAIPLYVSQIIDNEFELSLSGLISKLNGFQVRSYQKAPQKAKTTRRLVYGLREVTRYLARQKIQMIIAAKDLDAAFIESDYWVNIKEESEKQDIQIVYGLTRSELGKAVTGNPRVDIALVGVLGADGAYEEMKEILEKATELTSEWGNQIISMRYVTTPISCIAAYYGHAKLYQELLNMGLGDGFIPSSGDTDAHLAAAKGFLSVLKFCNDEQLSSKNYSMQTPLDLALAYNRRNVVKFLQSIAEQTVTPK